MSHRAHALVIDDDPELAETIEQILAFMECPKVECEVAHTGASALSIAEKLGGALDLAILDLRLPDRNGLDLLGDLRRLSPSAEFLVITGDRSVESAVAMVGARVFAYVLKPFRAEELAATVRHALEQVGLRRNGAALQLELELSERRHREVVEAIPAFVLALDAEGKILVWNQQLEDATGLSRTEMIGRDGSEFIGTGGDRRVDLKGGGHRLVHWQCTRVTDSSGQHVTYGLGIDVTTERQMLRRTLQMERHAAVGTLAAGLAHEVRNPLNSATLQLQVLRRRIERGTLEASELLPVAEHVREEISRVERLVTDFLAFAQPMHLELESTELNELLSELLGRVESEAGRRRIELYSTFEPDTGPVELEPTRMRQALLNLIQNAMDAMPEGGKLSLRTRPADAAGFVHVEVEDTGTGFAPEAPIFDAFFSTKPGGTGLGLAIVHRIVTEHGGVVRAEAKSPGARFTILLPQPKKP